MSVNRYRPHVLVLPEDDADRQLANGFHLEIGGLRQMQVLPEVGGWIKVVDCFKSDHVADMVRYPEGFMVLLIDFDDDQDRLETVKNAVPRHLADRVFVLGPSKDPQTIEPGFGPLSLDDIGKALATDCREETNITWSHNRLRHNATEIERLRERVRPILFP